MKVCFFLATRGNIAKTESIREALHGKAEMCFILGGPVEVDQAQGEVRRVSIMPEGTMDSTLKSVGMITAETTVILDDLKPDAIVIVADRFECLPVAMIAAYMNIPIIHIEGGEVSSSIDESIRHAITKLSHLHFPCTEKAREIVIQLGENPDDVFNFGSTSLDMLRKYENEDPVVDDDYLVFVHHSISSQIEKFGDVLEGVSGYDIVWIGPNIDSNTCKITSGLFSKVSKDHIAESYPVEIYAPLLKHAKCVIGNSSTGIRDAPYFGTPVVNIGDRQKGRERSPCIVDVPVDVDLISEAIRCQIEHGKYEPSYLYGDGTAGERIAEKILTHDFNIQKRFYDLGNNTCKGGEYRCKEQEHTDAWRETAIPMGDGHCCRVGSVRQGYHQHGYTVDNSGRVQPISRGTIKTT